MSISRETVHKVAQLNRIKVQAEKEDAWANDLTRIMNWIEQLSEVDTDGVEPLANVVDIPLVLRKDEVTDGGDSDKLLSNAPEQTQNFYVVNKIVE